MPILTAQKEKRLRRAALGAFVLTLLAILWESTPIGNRIEEATLDYRYYFFNRQAQASKQVLIIDIDEQSMKLLGPHYGRWPWPRRKYKDLIEFLSVGEPKGIYFDLLFSEPSEKSDDDELLGEISAQTGLVSHAMLVLTESPTEWKSNEDTPALPANFSERFGLKFEPAPISSLQKLPELKSYLTPTPLLLEKTPKTHIVSVDQDDDGNYRRVPILQSYKGTWLPSLTLRSILDLSGNNSQLLMQGNQLFIENKTQRPFQIPLNHDGRMRLHFYQPDAHHNFETVSFATVMADAARLQNGEIEGLKIKPEDLKDRIILIGASAAGLNDLKATPVSRAYPGVMLHATAISNIISGDFLKPIPHALQLGILGVTLLLVYGCGFFMQNLVLKILIPVLWLGGYGLLSIYLFQNHSFWIELARPSVLGIAALLDSLIYMSFVEGRDKKKLKETLSKYLPPTVTENLIASGQDPRAEVGQKRELSVLFSDIRGFTTLSESMNAEALVGVLNQYLGRMTDVVFDNLGTLDKFIGDAIMAFWGAPIADSEHAKKALTCALGMRDALVHVNASLLEQKMPQLKIGVGINTGEVIVGNIGSEKRLDYTVIGDNVNLASRMEGLTKQYHVGTLISGRTEELVRDLFICRPVDLVKVKGKAQHVKIFEPLGLRTATEAPRWKELSERFDAALLEYQKGHFEKAKTLFESTDLWMKSQGSEKGDEVSQLFIERSIELIAETPAEWDGVFVAKSK